MHTSYRYRHLGTLKTQPADTTPTHTHNFHGQTGGNNKNTVLELSSTYHLHAYNEQNIFIPRDNDIENIYKYQKG